MRELPESAPRDQDRLVPLVAEVVRDSKPTLLPTPPPLLTFLHVINIILPPPPVFLRNQGPLVAGCRGCQRQQALFFLLLFFLLLSFLLLFFSPVFMSSTFFFFLSSSGTKTGWWPLLQRLSETASPLLPTPLLPSLLLHTPLLPTPLHVIYILLLLVLLRDQDRSVPQLQRLSGPLLPTLLLPTSLLPTVLLPTPLLPTLLLTCLHVMNIVTDVQAQAGADVSCKTS